MKQYWVVIGVRENEAVRASFSSEKAAKEYAEYLKGTSKESFCCLVRELNSVKVPAGRKITSTLASRFWKEVWAAVEKGTAYGYYYVDKNTWLSSSFGHELNAMYYDSCLFGVEFDKCCRGAIEDVTCILHSEYLTWSTMNRMQAACRLLTYRVGFCIIDGEPWLVGNYHQVRLPVDEPFSLMRYVKVLFNIF